MWIFNEEDTGKMNAEIFSALAQLEKERGIPQAYMIDKISQALVAAYKKDKEGYTDNVFVDVSDGEMKLYVQKEEGHYGVFNGRRVRDEIYPRVRDFMRANDAAAAPAARPALLTEPRRAGVLAG